MQLVIKWIQEEDWTQGQHNGSATQGQELLILNARDTQIKPRWSCRPSTHSLFPSSFSKLKPLVHRFPSTYSARLSEHHSPQLILTESKCTKWVHSVTATATTSFSQVSVCNKFYNQSSLTAPGTVLKTRIACCRVQNLNLLFHIIMLCLVCLKVQVQSHL